MKGIVFAACALALGGCLLPDRVQTIALDSTFDETEIAWFKQPGKNTVKASAVLRQLGGTVVTCAGNEMTLMPVSTYASERIQKRYGGTQRGYWQIPDWGPILALPEAPADYAAARMNRICDPQGFATFTEVPDGDYYLTTEVVWQVTTASSASTQGGYLMHRVTVSGGESKEVVLTQYPGPQ